MKKQNINEEDWDFLIILDACRYDIFKEVYPEFLEGKLEKRKSRGSSTVEWLEKTFTNEYNYTYISANPFINSLGVPPSSKSKWKANEKFKKVIDVWETGWNENKNTVHPQDLIKESEKHLDEEKLIIHFIQPHRPYLTANFSEMNWGNRSRDKGLRGKEKIKWKLRKSLLFLFNPVWSKLDGRIKSKIRRIFRLEDGLFRRFYKRGEIDKIKKYYKENLKIALKSIASFSERVDGKIIITADHGEAFGENGVFEHVNNCHIPVLVEVPWFEVEGVKKG